MLEVVIEVDGRPLSALGLRRRRLRDADRLDRLRLLRRRAGRVAGGRGAADGADQRARAVRPAAGDLAPARCSPSRCSPQSAEAGVLWCDGRRTVRPAAGRPRRGAARRASRSGSPGCTTRRSPTGWWRSSPCRCGAGAVRSRRGPRVRHAGSAAAMCTANDCVTPRPHRLLACWRRCGSAASASSTTPCSSCARPHRGHRRDRRGQDDGRHRPRAAARRPGRRRRWCATGADRRAGRGPASRSPPATRPPCGPLEAGRRARRRRAAARADADSAEGRSRAHLGGRSVPGGRARRPGRDLVAVHGQSDQQRLLRPARQRARARPLRRGRGRRAARRATRAAYTRLRAVDASWPSSPPGAASAPRRPTCSASASTEIEAVDPQPGEDDALAAEERPPGHADALRTAAAGAHDALARRPATAPKALDAAALVAGARGLDRGRRPRPSAGRARRPARRVGYLLADVGRRPRRRTPTASTPTRAGWPRCEDRRAAARPRLTRKYGDDGRRGARVGRGRRAERLADARRRRRPHRAS